MNLLTRYCCLLYLLWATGKSKSEDQHCMNAATKEISVEIGGDNPQRVMTYIRDEPGYQVNLKCKWILKPATYENPRQMYIQVPVVDFDTKNVTEAQCNNGSNPQLDVFTLKLKLNRTTDRHAKWCSNKSVKIRKQIVNLWDPSYNLTLEFRSDDKQVRSEAKGLQVDVQVLGRDYCHRNMLFLDGSCYLITPEQLTPDEAFNMSRNFLGNVFTVPKNRSTSDFLRGFFKRNSDRRGEFPFESPLSLPGQKMWTGYFSTFRGDPPAVLNSVQFFDPQANCRPVERALTVYFKSSTNYESYSRCAVAFQWGLDGSANFTCESMQLQLPALLEFKQIPPTKGDMHPQLFRTCRFQPSPPPSLTPTGCGLLCIVIGVIVGVVFAGAAVFLAAYIVRQWKLRREQKTTDQNPAEGSGIPLKQPGAEKA